MTHNHQPTVYILATPAYSGNFCGNMLFVLIQNDEKIYNLLKRAKNLCHIGLHAAKITQLNAKLQVTAENAKQLVTYRTLAQLSQLPASLTNSLLSRCPCHEDGPPVNERATYLHGYKATNLTLGAIVLLHYPEKCLPTHSDKAHNYSMFSWF